MVKAMKQDNGEDSDDQRGKLSPSKLDALQSELIR